MKLLLSIIIPLTIGTVWCLALVINRRNVQKHHRSGNPDSDLIIFVEPVRWLFIIWGFASFCRGLRLKNCAHHVRLFRWSSTLGSLLVFPDLMQRKRSKRKARQLARYIDQCAADYPDKPIHLVGYSSGTYITLEACRRITNPKVIDTIILVAGSVSPHYALENLSGRVESVHVFYSRLDLITMLGPLLFGSNDRRHGPASGTVGFKKPPAFVGQRGWRPEDIILGYMGDHFSVLSSRFVARHMAPLLSNTNAGS